MPGYQEVIAKLERLAAKINALEIVNGDVDQGEDHIQIIVAPQSVSGTSIVPVKIKSYTNYNTYTADVYANGTDKDPSEEDAIIRVLDIADTETIPNDTILMATPLFWPDIDDSTQRKSYYTIDPARSY